MSEKGDTYLPENVLASVEAYLDGRDLKGDEFVLAAVARALATQLDAAVAAGSARGLSAGPPLARRLTDVLAVFAERDAAEAKREADAVSLCVSGSSGASVRGVGRRWRTADDR